MSSLTGGRNGVPPPMTTGLRKMRSSSTRPSSIAAAARPAPPISMSLAVAASAAAASLGHRRLGEPGVALNAVERAADDDLRDSAPDVGERGPELVVTQRRIGLPRQHGLVKPAAAQKAAEIARLRDVEPKLLLVRERPPERALAVGDKAVHRDAHRVDQHGVKLITVRRRTLTAMDFTIVLGIGLSFVVQAAPP